MQKKILEFCLSPDLGGLELFMVQCYRFFSEKTACLVMVQAGKKLDSYIEGEKHYLKRNKLFPFLPALKLARFIDQNDIDVVHFHWTKDMPTVVLAKTLSKKKPKLVQTRNMTMTRFKDDFYHKWLYSKIDMMHAVTNQVKEQLKRFIPQNVRPKIEMVYMGVKEPQVDEKRVLELQKHYDIKESDFVVGIVGRIEEGKGQWLLIEALKNLKNLDIKALIVGHTMDEAYLNELKEKVKSYGIEDKVIFTGFTKEVNEHFRLCNASVLATKQETFGLVVIEAMVNEVVVVATNKGGPLEIIDDGVDGVLFERNVEDLTAKLRWLYEHQDEAKNMAKKAKQKVLEKFEYTKQLEKLYKAIDEV